MHDDPNQSTSPLPGPSQDVAVPVGGDAVPVPIPEAAPEPSADDLAAAQHEAKVGFFFGLGAYLWWGFVPLYFKLVAHVPAILVLAHRIVWSIVFLAVILSIQRRWREVLGILREGRTAALLAITAVLVGINWWVFIHAVETDRVLQASLGYYLNPLVNVLLGFTVLRERLRPWQWFSVGLASIGVAVAATGAGGLPWIALTLAVTFGLYGLMRKMIRVKPMVGLLVETIVLLFPALVIIAWGIESGHDLNVNTYILLMFAGIVTAVPLIWFAAAARRLRLSTLGFLQYTAPSVQFLVAVIIFSEPLDARRIITFIFIWAALAVFSIESARRHQSDRKALREALAE